MRSKFLKPGPVRLVLRYVAEVFIIFLGITISFLFDQWRADRQKRQDLIELSQSLLMDVGGLKAKLTEDLSGSASWLRQLDSLRAQRILKTNSERQLKWFYEMITGQIYFLFEPHSPTYLSAANSSLYSELPDSIKNELYNLYQVRLPLFELLYNEQRQNIAHFRNNTVVPAGDFYHDDVTDIHPDLKKLAQEIEHPVYGNFINQVILLEKEVYKLNESDFVSLIELEASLRSYIEALKGG